MMKLIPRPTYLEQLKRFKDKQLVKVVTGIRRSGKSTLFDLFCEELKAQGVAQDQIVRINMEDPDNHEIDGYLKLYNRIKEQLVPDRMNYVFIDEVQVVPEFQRAVDGLFIKKNCDVYITGSNAYLLSGELATLLSGRYVEIRMLPLSFSEFIDAVGSRSDLSQQYLRYIQNGSFPYVLQLQDKQDIRTYLDGIYTSIVLKDIVTRKHITDVAMLDSVIRFMFDTIGNLFSSTKIADTMTSAGRKISVHTVESYLGALVESFVLCKVGRYDVKGRHGTHPRERRLSGTDAPWIRGACREGRDDGGRLHRFPCPGGRILSGGVYGFGRGWPSPCPRAGPSGKHQGPQPEIPADDGCRTPHFT